MEVETTEDIQRRLTEILAKYDGKSFDLMVAGGSLLRLLAECDLSSINSSNWHIFFSDERCDTEYRNFSAAREFLSHISPSAHAHSIGICENRLHSAMAYEETLHCYVRPEDSSVIDVCLLGIGKDGHICSIWPDSEALDSERWVLYVKASNSVVSPERMTVTMKFLNERVRSLYFVIPCKNGKVQKMKEPDPEIKKRLLIPYTIIVGKPAASQPSSVDSSTSGTKE